MSHLAAVDRYAAHIAEAAQRFGVPVAWIRAVMHVESRGDERAISPVGAMGLMQIMPATWSNLRDRHGLGNDPFDPHDNILAGAAYLREMYDRYGSPGFLAAYNAGPGRVNQWIARFGHPASPDVDVIDWIEKIPFSETRNYVQRVLESLHVYRGRLPQAASLSLAATTWRPQAVWCVYSCGVLLDGQQAALERENDR